MGSRREVRPLVYREKGAKESRGRGSVVPKNRCRCFAREKGKKKIGELRNKRDKRRLKKKDQPERDKKSDGSRIPGSRETRPLEMAREGKIQVVMTKADTESRQSQRERETEAWLAGNEDELPARKGKMESPAMLGRVSLCISRLLSTYGRRRGTCRLPALAARLRLLGAR